MLGFEQIFCLSAVCGAIIGPGVGLVFGMDGPGKLFQLNESDDLVYFGSERGSEQQGVSDTSHLEWSSNRQRCLQTDC